jgi:hypothetical protein
MQGIRMWYILCYDYVVSYVTVHSCIHTFYHTHILVSHIHAIAHTFYHTYILTAYTPFYAAAAQAWPRR